MPVLRSELTQGKRNCTSILSINVFCAALNIIDKRLLRCRVLLIQTLVCSASNFLVKMRVFRIEGRASGMSLWTQVVYTARLRGGMHLPPCVLARALDQV